MRLGALAVGTVILLVACQPAAWTNNPEQMAQVGTSTSSVASAIDTPEVRRLLAAAREGGETQLDLSWSASSLGGYEGAARYEALFNRMYGTAIKITLTPGPSVPEMHAKVIQELAAGRKASTDLLFGGDAPYALLLPRDVLEPYDYTLLSPRITPEIVAVGNIGVEIYSTIPAILYNSELVRGADVPVYLEDVLEPKWKGRVAASQTVGEVGRLAFRPDWGFDRVRTFVSRLSQQVGGLLRQSEDTRLVTGEFLMFVMGTTHGAREAQRTGAPIGYVIGRDAAVAGFQHLGVPRNAVHPNLAKLFINMIVSEEGQRVLWETYATDHHLLPGSQTEAEIADLKRLGTGIFSIHAGMVVERPEMAQFRLELERTLATAH
jgi:iron(III) transport system substrate-binding protein